MKQFIKHLLAVTTGAIPIAIAILLSSCNTADSSKVNTPAAGPAVSAAAYELKTNMRKLWVEHVSWTRNAIFCLVDDLPGTEQVVQRLLQNQVDIGNAFKTYYGDPAGKKLTELLHAHITIAVEVIKAVKVDEPTAIVDAQKKWNANADEISAFLSASNPTWTLADMKMMMNDHLKLTTDEIIQRVNQDYTADIQAYDKVQAEILKMSDMLTDGITQQFPKRF